MQSLDVYEVMHYNLIIKTHKMLFKIDLNEV